MYGMAYSDRFAGIPESDAMKKKAPTFMSGEGPEHKE